MQKEWFSSWFDTPYYHTLYKSRDYTEASLFIDNITHFLNLKPNSVCWDLCCGKGRHSIYLNQKAYFPIQVTVKHVTPDPEEGVVRHGTVYLKNEENNVALQHFVKFVESASMGLKKDSGDLMVTRIS